MTRVAQAYTACCWGLGIATDTDVLDEIVRRWSEPHRHYHDLSHLEACLELFDRVRSAAERPAEVIAALLFHDAIYDPTRSDNESASAALACSRLVGAQPAALARIAASIEATRTHTGTGDAALVIDVDLAILGAAPEVYDGFEAAIRREYAFVPIDAYRRGRGEVLARFAARRPIFRTAELRDELEDSAHANLARARAALDHPAGP